MIRCAVLLLLFSVASVTSQTLTVVSANVWSGLTYAGATRIGSFEDEAARDRRIDILIGELRRSDPDIVLLQEVNPVGEVADRVAAALGFDVVRQRVLGGVKLGPVGLPVNLNEGLAILARPSHELRFVDLWMLSDGFGAVGDVISFHFAEVNAALVASVKVGGTRWLVVNTHLSSAVPDDSTTRAVLDSICRHRNMAPHEAGLVLDELAEGSSQRARMVHRLAGRLLERSADERVVVGGDFNARAGAPELQSLLDAGYRRVDCPESLASWDPEGNILIRSQRRAPASVQEELDQWYDAVPRTIDHLFLSPSLGPVIAEAEVLRDRPGSLPPSDHRFVLGRLTIDALPSAQEQQTPPTVDALPIVSYDTDVGFGFGVKLFALNTAGVRESFDAVLFNSTKGERWYRFVFSMPDLELRQGTRYPLAVDIVLDYDKYLRNSFFGVGSEARYADREFYTREPFEVQAVFSRGITEETVIQAGARYKIVRNFGFTDTSGLRDFAPPSNGRASAVSLSASLRHDTRNSYINPSRGIVVQGEAEFALPTSFTNAEYNRAAFWFQSYSTLFYPTTVLAWRVGVQALAGGSIPVQLLLPVGGNSTLRGFPQDRYLDRAAAVTNVEIRFPIAWRFGGVAGWDAGRVWSSVRKATFSQWSANPVVGLRFFMDTFLVRADVGFGPETTGFYLNFGHVF